MDAHTIISLPSSLTMMNCSHVPQVRTFMFIISSCKAWIGARATSLAMIHTHAQGPELHEGLYDNLSLGPIHHLHLQKCFLLRAVFQSLLRLKFCLLTGCPALTQLHLQLRNILVHTLCLSLLFLCALRQRFKLILQNMTAENDKMKDQLEALAESAEE